MKGKGVSDERGKLVDAKELLMQTLDTNQRR